MMARVLSLVMIDVFNEGVLYTTMLADEIRELRAKNNLTQVAFAETIGVAPITVGKYEAGETVPTLKILIRISSIYDVELGWLLEQSEAVARPKRGRPRRNKSEKDEKALIATYRE